MIEEESFTSGSFFINLARFANSNVAVITTTLMYAPAKIVASPNTEKYAAIVATPKDVPRAR